MSPDDDLDDANLEDEDFEEGGGPEEGLDPDARASDPESLGPEALDPEALDPEALDPEALALDAEDLELDDGEEVDGDGDGDDEDGEDGEEADGEGGEGAAPAATKAAAPAKSKKLIDVDEDEEEPGPDTPAPPKKKIRDALAWAFDKEDIEESVLDRFADHAHLMLEWNRKVHLTSSLDLKEIAAKDYLDCWRITRMASLVGKTILDLGTGPGFPGLPLALAEPHCKVILVDARKRKTDFLQHVIETLGVKNATAVWGRAEEFLETTRVDMVVARAISSVRENVRTLRKVRHSVKDLLMLKGHSWSREVRAGEREAERLGFILDTVWEHELPEEMGKRAILVYRAPGSL